MQDNWEQLFDAFNEYKWSVPVCGAIILSQAMDKALLVRGFHKGASWGFPKGKIAREEAKLAVRHTPPPAARVCASRAAAAPLRTLYQTDRRRFRQARTEAVTNS